MLDRYRGQGKGREDAYLCNSPMARLVSTVLPRSMTKLIIRASTGSSSSRGGGMSLSMFRIGGTCRSVVDV